MIGRAHMKMGAPSQFSAPRRSAVRRNRAAVLHVVLHFRQSYSKNSVPCRPGSVKGYTLRIGPRIPRAGAGGRGRAGDGVSRGFGAEGGRGSVSITLHSHADTESYPQLPHSFQQAEGGSPKGSRRYGGKWKIRNRSSLSCKSTNSLDIIPAQGEKGME